MQHKREQAAKTKRIKRELPASVSTVNDGGRDNDPFAETTAIIAEMQQRMESRADLHQKNIERATSLVGRPVVLYGILAFIALWIIINVSLKLTGREPFDAAPFFWLQGFVGSSGLIVALMVLITQNRQGKASNLRDQVNLHTSVLTEREVTKLVEMVEALRQDMPNIPHDPDPEVDSIKAEADPRKVAEALEQAALLSENGRAKQEEEEQEK